MITILTVMPNALESASGIGACCACADEPLMSAPRCERRTGARTPTIATQGSGEALLEFSVGTKGSIAVGTAVLELQPPPVKRDEASPPLTAPDSLAWTFQVRA